MNPGLRIARTLSPIEPPRTRGTLGSTISIVYGHSSVTATASRSTVRDQTLTLFWPRTRTDICSKRDGTFSFASAGLPETSANVAASAASGLAEKSTGTTTWLAAIAGASTETPAGQAARPRR